MTTFTTAYDAEYETWTVLDADGDEMETCETEAEAKDAARKLSDEAEVEHLSDAIAEAVEQARLYGNLEALRRMADFVGGIR